MTKLTVSANNPGAVIDKCIYGHFSEHLGRCIYEGLWVGEGSPIDNTRGIRNDVVEALKTMGIPMLRWPGGCFADEYHWKDGIGPKEARKRMINTHWGGVVEDNSFGTHEFLDLCAQLGCEPYISGNLGSGTVQEMQEWVEYMTFSGVSPMADLRRKNGREEPWSLKYFGVGNENWGCGGNMRAEYYADEYRRYNTYLRNFGGNKLFRIACGPNSADYNWTEVLMREAGGKMDGLSLHNYTISSNEWMNKGPATGFGEDHWYSILSNALRMEELVTKHSAIMDQYDPEKRVALVVDEWGTWHQVEPGTNPGFLYQQNTVRDALVAGIHLNIFNNHADRVRIANVAQVVNVLQAVILTEGAKMLLTPTYHVFEMYKGHQGATLLPVTLDAGEYCFGEGSLPQLHASASRAEDGSVLLTVCNLDPHRDAALDCAFAGLQIATAAGRVLTGAAMDACNTFEAPETVRPQALAVTVAGGAVRATLPPMSVAAIKIQ